MNAPWLKNFIDVASDQVSDIIIGPPVTLKSRILTKGVRTENIERLNYEAHSPWLYVKRECKNKDNNIEVINTIIIFTTFIPNEDLKTSTYKQLKDDLEKKLNKSIIVFSHAT